MMNSLLKFTAAGSILKVIYDKMHPVLSLSGWEDISNLMRSHSIITAETFVLGVLLFMTLLIQKTETFGFGVLSRSTPSLRSVCSRKPKSHNGCFAQLLFTP